jgi:hypothetical protein
MLVKRRRHRRNRAESAHSGTSDTAYWTILAGFATAPCAIMPAMENVDKVEAGNDVDPVIEAYKKDIDVTLIRENLRLTVEQRFEQLMKLQQFAEDLRRAGRKHAQRD